jgi:D-glycero-D-manno-heptose 1,7-bisphosphate phosphatase
MREGKPFSPHSIDQVKIYKEVQESVVKLKQSNFEIVVVTNQPEISRGNLTLIKVNDIHNHITKKTGITNFYICPHDDNQNCYCRKPKPGLLYDAVVDLNIDLKGSYMIGDRWRDVDAGNNAGCEQTYFINRHYDEPLPSKPYSEVKSLSEAVEQILENMQ